VNFLFPFQLISFVSRPDRGQIVFKKRARLLVTETFFDAFFERVQTTVLSYLSRTPINSFDAAWSRLAAIADGPAKKADLMITFEAKRGDVAFSYGGDDGY
jgi:hypothetical protein